MSVGFCAHLYQPDEPFNANVFESWFHRSPRYLADDESEKEDEVAQDYVPSYSWLDSAVAELKARNKKVIPKAATTPLFHLVPLKRSQLEPCEEDEVWDSEGYGARLELMESLRLLRNARARHGAYTDQELIDYVAAILSEAKLFHDDLQPSFIRRMLDLIPGKKQPKK